MDEAIRVQAELLAKKGAKNKGTESKLYMEGYADCAMFLAKHPLLMEMIAALDVGWPEKPPAEPPGTD